MSLYYNDGSTALFLGDVQENLENLEDGSVDCIITSPPYFGLRDYGVDGQMGLEKSPDEYVKAMSAVFIEAKRVLAADGTFWLNLGDSSGKGKQLLGIPWRMAFALQDAGWILRSEIIWHKPNAMPESIKDRVARSHETIFMFAKSPKYFFDADAIKEPVKEPNSGGQKFGGNTDAALYAVGSSTRTKGNVYTPPAKANKRDVWTVSTKPYKGAHFATFPDTLIEPMVRAGSKRGGVVLDPFSGSGTTGLVALREGRKYIGIELNPEFMALQMGRLGLESLETEFAA